MYINNFIERLSQSQQLLITLQNPHIPIDKKDQPPEALKISQKILNILEKEYNYSETEEEIKQKDKKVQKLREIILNWISQVAEEKQIDFKYNGDLLIFGSYKLKVNQKNSDIDAVCFVPSFVECKKHFFGDLFHILSQKKEVEDIFSIQHTSVPLIKMRYFGIPFDISFSKQSQSQFKSDLDIKSIQILQGMDEKSIRALNGYRVAEWFNQNIKNKDTFKKALKCIKLWAQNRCIYSNILGYLNGIAWSILVAKICQLYPNYFVYGIIERFFFLYSRWKWHDMAVQIEYIQEDIYNQMICGNQWVPENKGISNMMIITPCFPCINCAYNVTESTLRVIQEQFQYGYRILDEIQKNQSHYDYQDLFKPFEFFKRYNAFLQIRILAKNKNEYFQWKGHVEINLRKLTKIIENGKLSKIILIHPFSKFIDLCLKEQLGDYSLGCVYFYGIKVKDNQNDIQISFEEEIKKFLEILEFGDKIPQLVNISIKCVRQQQVFAFNQDWAEVINNQMVNIQ
ncbi:nuclear poly polymerase npap nucleotidyltransferase protein binding, putative [Ichthyophthirius multifiliis]|uniref:polynucleotide adenylyltransferase n=1 Tax=Ichthyophthirius multifiliis TaxID=5932 RepID=G0R5K8_ICHMU|nr:nuclear poly polymerase npap nucleotidyltransferase protein binding, putative [Ichthyophthirius multifiliis]EGR27268.1 nuclear poly polymerase npap nucleotidyltransferase protein binding, putative [Ichthyophthirius multifiliis]|eukprot:XP_004024152.1 nuclear poly polymerase npap nucleotidyltransferase protein binding, putative [Ichthyophthirius multifiliis]